MITIEKFSIEQDEKKWSFDMVENHNCITSNANKAYFQSAKPIFPKFCDGYSVKQHHSYVSRRSHIDLIQTTIFMYNANMQRPVISLPKVNQSKYMSISTLSHRHVASIISFFRSFDAILPTISFFSSQSTTALPLWC